MLLDGDPFGFIAFFIIIFVSFPLHEMAHAFTADYFGDNTPRMHGRTTWNPLAHIDIMGAVLLAVAGFGWAKAVPINEYELMRRHPQAPMLVALVGPLTNFALGIVGAIVYRGVILLGVSNAMVDAVLQVMFIFVLYNILLMLFNLIPLFPLDGEKILLHLLPAEMRKPLLSLRRFNSIPLLVILFLLPRLGLDVMSFLIIRPMWILVGWMLGV